MKVSRRRFLAGSAAAAALPGALPGRLRPPDSLRSLGPGPAPLTLKVNGRSYDLEVEPRATLLETLRWQAGVTGPKEVCDRGACGACTVLVDGEPRLACMTLAVETAGRQITTVEGLGTPENPSPVQAAMIQHDAVQCGYCIPGFVMSFEAERRRNPGASAEDYREAIRGNLCRCGTYNKMFEVCERLAGGDPPAGLAQRNAAVSLESERPRVDGPPKITGTAVYGADVNRPGMLFAQHVPCPYGKAKLLSADLDAVRRLPGVIEAELEVGREFEFCGEPAGFVCADSPAALRDAMVALGMQWDYEIQEQDPVQRFRETVGAFPPEEQDLEGFRRADRAKEALAKADLVVERVYRTQVQNHSTLEPHGGMVDPTTSPPEGWFSTQGTRTCLEGMARGLELDADEVVVKCDYVGGGFGSKFGAGREGLLAAELAKRHGRPVRVFNNREYEHLDTGNRPGSLQWMRIGCTQDGRITGGFVHTVGIVGGGGRGGLTNPSRYDFGEIAKKHQDVILPFGSPRAFRAPGHPQGMFAVESMMDELAEAAGLDPVEFRLRNETSDVRREMLPAGAKEIGWERRQPTGAQNGRLRRGFGCGVGDWGNSQGRCAIGVRVRPDGILRLYSSTQDIGTGQRTVIADLAADTAGIPRELVEVSLGFSPYPAGPASGGSVTARFTAPAVRDAVTNALAEIPGLDGRRAAGAAEWLAACKQLPADGIKVDGSFNREFWGEGGSEGVQFAEVLVDVETGVVTVERIVALQACGLAVNRLTAENQLLGGVIQGLSFALFEDKTMDNQIGCQLNSDLQLYKIAGSADVPEIVPLLWGTKDGLGVRSLGEPTTIPTAGAIANAVANALGARVREIPITPQRVLAALEERA